MSRLRLTAAIEGDLEKFMAEELKTAERAVTDAVREATDGLKNEIRAQVSARLGPRLSKSIRGEVYPRGERSLNAAGLVYARSPHILEGFELGSTILPRADRGVTFGGRSYLVIPTPNAPVVARRGGAGGKVTSRGAMQVAEAIKRFGKLKIAKGAHGRLVLYADVIRGKSGGFRTATKGRRRQGRKPETVALFILVPSVRLKKLLNIQEIGQAWAGRLSNLIVKHWHD